MNENEDKNRGEQWELIKRSLEDADRMIYYVSKEKTEEKDVLDCLDELSKITAIIRKNYLNKEALDETDIVYFFNQITIMSHILYPVTSESLKAMDDLAIRPLVREKGNLIRWLFFGWSWFKLICLILFAIIIGVVVTPKVFNFSLEGAFVIEKLDATLKKRTELRSDLIEAAINCSETLNQINNSSGSNVDISLYKAIEILRKFQFNGIMLGSLTDKLDEWNQAALSLIPNYKLFLLAFSQSSTNKNEPGKEEELSISKKINSIQDGNCENADCKKLLCAQITELPDFNKIKKNMSIKNNALIILQTLNSCILLLLFGCCGATAYVLRKTIQQIHNYTFTGIEWKELLRITLGTFTGFFLGYLSVSTDLVKLLLDEGGHPGVEPDKILSVSPLVFAFIGGYSIDLLFDILNRFIYAITNDEKYLPAAEQMKRKVDVRKLIDKDNNVATPHMKQKGDVNKLIDKAASSQKDSKEYSGDSSSNLKKPETPKQDE